MKKILAGVLTAVMLMCLLPAAAFAQEFDLLPQVVASNNYVEKGSYTREDGTEYVLYTFPAGTTFAFRKGFMSGMDVFRVWDVKGLDRDESYIFQSYPGDDKVFTPEPGVVYLLEQGDTLTWFTNACIVVQGGSVPTDPEPEQPERIFSDVDPNAWYASFVETVYEKGLFAGAGDGTFAPEANMTYAEFLTVLSQFSGETLTPVTGGAWYDTYVQWAQPLIPAGMAENFNPTAPITRQDVAALFGTFLSLYDHSGETVNPGQASYKDAGAIADYAQSGVQLCYQLGIMSGGSDGTFAPQATATRAQVAVTMVQMARVMGK